MAETPALKNFVFLAKLTEFQVYFDKSKCYKNVAYNLAVQNMIILVALMDYVGGSYCQHFSSRIYKLVNH